MPNQGSDELQLAANLAGLDPFEAKGISSFWKDRREISGAGSRPRDQSCGWKGWEF